VAAKARRVHASACQKAITQVLTSCGSVNSSSNFGLMMVRTGGGEQDVRVREHGPLWVACPKPGASPARRKTMARGANSHGLPDVPDVYEIVEMSPGFGGTAGARFICQIRINFSIVALDP
jgi:hypothetical protein